MKKLFLLSAFLSVLFLSSQTTVTNFTGNGATITNTGTAACSLSVVGNYSQVAIQTKVTKTSGTLTSSATAILQGSVDGVNYKDITTDTLKFADVATNTKIWIMTGNDYLYYKVAFQGAGTMVAVGYAYLYPVPLAASRHAVNNMLSVFSQTSDTVDNSGTGYVVKQLADYYRTVSIQAVVTKISGTAGGTVTLQGSIDGTNYVTVSSSFSTAQTLSVTNVTTNSKLFVITGAPYRFYRLWYAGTGTMSCTIKGFLMPNR